VNRGAPSEEARAIRGRKRPRRAQEAAARDRSRFDEDRCAICGSPPPPGRRLDLDHEDTPTGPKYRGLTCRACNNGLGMFRHDTRLLLRAVDYLTGAPLADGF
jgi:hypothetical protein